MFFAEGTTSRVAYHYDSSSAYDYPVSPHNGGTTSRTAGIFIPDGGTFNLVYVDGHASNMQIRDVPIKNLNKIDKVSWPTYCYFWFPDIGTQPL
jgi:prepilin-type processing-associated H-X9-DG protein